MASKGKKSFVVYEDWARIAVESGDAELAMAIIAHGIGQDTEISNPVAKALFKQIVSEMDKNAEKYDKTCEERSKAKKEYWDRKKQEQDSTTDIQKDTSVLQKSTSVDMIDDRCQMIDDRCSMNDDNESLSETKEKKGPDTTYQSPKKRSPVGNLRTQQDILNDLLPNYEISSVVESKLREWLTYKTERREPYKPMGLKALLGKIVRGCNDYGDEAIVDMLDNAMSSGYKGPVWDRLDKPRQGKSYVDAIEHRFDDINAWVQKGET